MKKLVPYTIFPLLLGFVLFLYGFSSNRNERKKIKNIVVEFQAGDNHFLTHKAVNKLLIQNEKPVKNLLKSSVDLYLMEQNVLRNPFVDKASVSLSLDGVLKVKVKQRKPIARIISEQGNYYVDKYGNKVPLSTNFSARVPLVLGVKSDTAIKELAQLIKFILEDDFLKKEIVGIHKSKNNEYTFVVRSGDYKIDFGKIKDVEVKFKKIKAFYNKALFDNSIKKYTKINVKYHNQVVCTK